MKNCNKLNPNCPPDISGEFKELQTAYGNIHGTVIPLEKPLVIGPYKDSFEQNELFVKQLVDFDHPRLPERESIPGVWKKNTMKI